MTHVLSAAIALTCSAVCVKVSHAKDPDSLPLHNAFYIAKAITSNKLTPEQKKSILGALYWYAQNETDDVNTTETFWKVLQQYPVLNTEAKKIAQDVFPGVNLIALQIKDLKFLSEDDMPKKDSIINLKKKLDSLKAQLREDSIRIIKDKLFILRAQDVDTTRTDSLEIKSSIIYFEKRLAELLEIQSSIKQVEYRLEQIAMRLDQSSIQDILQKGRSVNPTRDALNLSAFSQKYIDVTWVQENKISDPSTRAPLGIPNKNQLYDALAIYLVKRVKQEAVMWFFDVLRKNMDAYDLVQTCFPACVELLQSDEIYETPKLGNIWRYAITSDYASMPEHLFGSDWLQTKLGTRPWILETLRTSWNFSRLIAQNYSFSDAITMIYTNQQMQFGNVNGGKDFNQLVTLLFALNEEMRAKDKRRLQFSDLVAMSNVEFEMMLSLIDLRYDHVFRNIIMRDQARIDLQNTRQLNAIRKWLGNIQMAVQHFENVKADYQKYVNTRKETGDLQFQFDEYNVWHFLKTLFISLDFSSLGADHAVFRTADTNTVSILQTMGKLQEVYRLLENKNFGAFVAKLFETVSTLIPPQEPLVMERDSLLNYLQANRLHFFSEVQDQFSTESVQKKFGYAYDPVSKSVTIQPNSLLGFLFSREDVKAVQTIQKLSAFLNDVVYTKDSKQLAQVIETYALPPGSYKLKRGSWFSIDLNAYVGTYGGLEWIYVPQGKFKDRFNSRGAVYGLTAPVGIALSKTFGRRMNYIKKEKLSDDFSNHPDHLKFGRKHLWTRSGSTISLFFSVIDIGSIVSYRFKSDTAVLPQQVNWSQVFSPGVHLNLGIKSTPLVLAVGYQYTPRLRKVVAEGESEQFNANRIYAGVKFDLPLSNIHLVTENQSRIRQRKYVQ